MWYVPESKNDQIDGASLTSHLRLFASYHLSLSSSYSHTHPTFIRKCTSNRTLLFFTKYITPNDPQIRNPQKPGISITKAHVAVLTLKVLSSWSGSASINMRSRSTITGSFPRRFHGTCIIQPYLVTWFHHRKAHDINLKQNVGNVVVPWTRNSLRVVYL